MTRNHTANVDVLKHFFWYSAACVSYFVVSTLESSVFFQNKSIAYFFPFMLYKSVLSVTCLDRSPLNCFEKRKKKRSLMQTHYGSMLQHSELLVTHCHFCWLWSRDALNRIVKMIEATIEKATSD